MSETLTVTISVKLFAELAIREFAGFIETDDSIFVKELSVADKQEQFIHVEQIGIKRWQIWAIRDWKQAYVKHQKDKAIAEQNRQSWDKLQRNIKTLAAAVCKVTGLDQELAAKIALDIINKKPSAAINFGCKLEE